ncbi:MAG: excinuclease ABC subunit UvrA [Succinivibrionaceae bacterium]|nr:excinuclease ABC subunit UvrA [Succinivibrionaceae bacterium]
MPDAISIRGARVHNLKNVDVEIPLHRIVGIAGVSGSGKSSLALGTVYAEGSRRYLESLSAYTRRRMTQARKAAVDEILHVPAAIALHQRPASGGIRSTFGTGTELLNSLRLMFSRLASHRCPRNHLVPPSIATAAEQQIVCPECSARFYGPSAEELSFNSQGACTRCQGTGTVRTVDESTLVPDESLSIDQGAVLPWQTLMWSLMKDIARAMGVRTDVPFCQLTAREREIVFHGPAVKKNIIYQNKTSGAAGDMDFTYFNAVYTVENALSKVKDEKGMKRVEKFLRQEVCPECGGTRLSARARGPMILGIGLDAACRMTLSELDRWVRKIPESMPQEMRKMARSIVDSFLPAASRLQELGLGYLTLDRSASTLSTGERQRMQLARVVRNRTTGALYVLDEPSIGLHPANLEGLARVMDDLVSDGNSVLLVDHDVNILKHASHLVELGPEAGAKGGRLIAQGSVSDLASNQASVIGPYLNRTSCDYSEISDDPFEQGRIALSIRQIHTVKPLTAEFPKGRLTCVTGVSGSGKTTLILECLVPALEAALKGYDLPQHVTSVSADGIREVKLIDASPIGINVRSTVATYADIHDELRKIFARSPDAKKLKLKAGDFSYNTGSLRCRQCDGTGSITLDVQFLPDVSIPCPGCKGQRYDRLALEIRRKALEQERTISLPELMNLSIDEAMDFCRDMPAVCKKLETLSQLGLGYLTLGEDTPNLSGGEAQRLKLAGEMDRRQESTLFVFDEPSIGLHPKDVETLLKVFRKLTDNGATVVVIEHDLDIIRQADHIIDMGPLGGDEGGRIVATGNATQIRTNPDSITGRYL